MKKLVVLLLLISLFIPTMSLAAQTVTDSDLYYPPPYEKEVYVVRLGDTLSSIAEMVYGNAERWKDIWKLNPQIADPNLIYVGQQLTIRETPIMRDRGEYRKQIRESLIKSIFKIRGLPYMDEWEAKSELSKLYLSLGERTEYGILSSIDSSTFTAKEDAYRTIALLERIAIYELVDAILLATKDDPWDDASYLLAAVAWQESHFFNRRGKHGERSCFQILPSTARLLDKTIEWQVCLDQIERYPDYAAKLAWRFLKDCYQQYGSYRRALVYYNGEQIYAERVIWKFHALRRGGVK